MDTLGTGQAMLFIFGEKPEELPEEVVTLCTNYSDAVRMSYSLRDFLEDICVWIVNIPKEDAQKFGITMADIDALAGHGKISSASDNIKAWMRAEIQAAKELFEKGSAAFTHPKLSELSRKTMEWTYVEDFWRDIHRVENELNPPVTTVPTRNTVAALIDGHAMIQSLMNQYADTLKLNPTETKRFIRKSQNLFLMYLGFAKDRTYRAIDGAALSWFLSAYYDWVTDGPRAGAEAQEGLLGVLKKISQNTWANGLVQDMLQKDVSKTLADDGLERGAISFIFILEMMGLREEYEKKCDIQEVGKMLQVIDDIDDWEDDTAQWDWNVLNTPKASEYLNRLEVCFADNGASIFPGKLLILFIEKARKKAKNLQFKP